MTGDQLFRALLGSCAFVVAYTANVPATGSRNDPAQPAFQPADAFDPRTIAGNLCGRSDRPSFFSVRAALAAPQPANISARSPLFEGLGTLTYKITTSSPKTQAFFDQGLRLFYAFNPGEAVASFRAAGDADPSCAMCAWGEALTLGPNLNGPMDEANNEAALAAVAKAQGLAAGATPQEQALIAAIAARYAPDKNARRDDLNIAYADAMAKVYAAYRDDPEIAAITVEAAMNVRSQPWGRGWDKTGRIPTGYLGGAIVALESLLAAHPDHPGGIHLYIHAVGNSVYLEKSVAYAERLGALMPAAGHMVHMPSHTLYNVGRYKDALASNMAAITADEAYLKGPAAATEVYRYGLYEHNVFFAMSSAIMAGDEAAARQLIPLMKAFYGQSKWTPWEVAEGSATQAVVRFGSPEEMLALPRPETKKPYLLGIWHYARGSAYAYQNDPKRAVAKANAIDKLRSGRKPKVQDMGADLLGIAAEVLRGRAAVAQGKWVDAADHFGKAVAFQDKVPYRDPPLWDFPVRQAQGMALYKAGKLPQAGETLRQALIDFPNSGYALYALKDVSSALGDTAAAAEYSKLFDKAWAGSKPPALDRF